MRKRAGAGRLRRALWWVEEQLNQRHAAAGCLVIAAVALPFVVVLAALDLYALFDPAAGRFYRQEVLRWTALQDIVALFAYIGVIVYCLPRYRSAEPQPLLAYGLVTFMLVTSTNLVILYGHKDTPLALVLLASFVLTRAWFPLRVLLPGLLVSAGLILLAEVLIRRQLMPYAPLLTEPVVTGHPLAWWWAIWMRVLYDMAVVFFSTAMFFIFAIMARRHRALEELVRIDTLTGLLNRATFLRLLEEEFARQARGRRPFCLMMCDVDHFKRVNDSYGHAAGDQVLARFGQLLREAVRQPLDVAARFGGEEFVVLLPETDLAAAQHVAERIGAQLRQQVFEADGRRFSVTLSIGIAQAGDGNSAKALHAADENLYRAKHAGRDRVVGSVVA